MFPKEKAALATMYFPHLSSHRACDRLRRWIRRVEPLRLALERVGYQPTQRILTPRQVELIILYLGAPG